MKHALLVPAFQRFRTDDFELNVLLSAMSNQFFGSHHRICTSTGYLTNLHGELSCAVLMTQMTQMTVIL
jgi:hypothetical protein